MKRLSVLKKRHLLELVRYFISGSVAVGIDISLLYILRQLGVWDFVAVSISVSISVFFHYVISRYFVFRSFRRSFISGLLYFVSIIGLSVIVNVIIYLLLSALFPEHFILARIASVSIVGLFSFFMNAKYNFKTFQ